MVVMISVPLLNRDSFVDDMSDGYVSIPNLSILDFNTVYLMSNFLVMYLLFI